MLTISIIIVACLAAFALMPPKKKPFDTQVHREPYRDTQVHQQVHQQVSIRQQMIDEDAAALSQSFRAASDDKWRAEVNARGVELLSVKPSA